MVYDYVLEVIVVNKNSFNVTDEDKLTWVYKEPNFALKLVNSCPACCLLLKDGIVELTNSFVENFLGIKKGDKLSDFYHEPDENFNPMPTEDENNYQNWISLNMKSHIGSVKPMEINMYSLMLNSEQYVLVWLRDVAIKRQAEQVLQLYSAQSRKNERDDSMRLEKVKYETRKAIDVIIGMTELAKQTGDAKYFDLVQNAAHDLLESVENSDDFQETDDEIASKEFELEVIFDNVESQVKGLADRRGLFYENQIQPDLPKLFGAAERLERVLKMVVKNAIGFTKSGGITISVSDNDRDENSITLMFSVRDTGCGMPQEQVDALFPQFIDDIDPDAQVRFGNGGLSLTICKALVDLLGGRIWCSSEEGVGTTIYFTAVFNLNNQEATDNDVFEDVEQITFVPKGEIILLVDDNKVNQTVAFELLRRKGFTVLLADGGAEAIDAIKSNADIRLVLMDVYMSDIDGLTTTKIIRDIRPELPVIALTARALPGDRELCLSIGMQEYFTKPFSVDSFMKMVYRWIN